MGLLPFSVKAVAEAKVALGRLKVSFILSHAFYSVCQKQQPSSLCSTLVDRVFTSYFLNNNIVQITDSLLMLVFLQKLLMVKNPDSYLIQNNDLSSALVMEKASFSWSPPDVRNGSEHPQDDSQNTKHTSDNKHALRNISFTLPKVCVL